MSTPSAILRAARVVPTSRAAAGIPRSIIRTYTSQPTTILRNRNVLTAFRPQTSPRLIPSIRSFATTTSDSTTRVNEDEPSSNKPPSPGLAGKLKDLMTKYGRHALAVYLFLSGIDLTITFVLVHLAGADKIEWVKDYVVGEWRTLRYGADAAQEMQRLEEEEQRVKDAQEIAESGTAAAGSNQGTKKKAGNAMLWAEFALAYGIHKTLLLPVRVGATAAVTPKLVHWLTARGWVGKGGVARAASHASGKVKQASVQAQDRVKVASDRVKEITKRTKE